MPQVAEIEIANPQPQMLRLRMIAEILEPRARELMYYVKESLRQGGVVEALGAGCVLTGGGAMLPGMLDVTESQLRVPARTGMPVRLSHMPGELVHPGFAAAIGMLLYAHRTRVTRAAEEQQFARQTARHFCSKLLEYAMDMSHQDAGGPSRDGTAEETKPERCAFNITTNQCAAHASR